MIEVVKYNKRQGFNIVGVYDDMATKEGIKKFYLADTLAERIMAMANVRFDYESVVLKYNFSGMPMDDDFRTLVGQFHKLSTTLMAEELGDNAQYIDKFMDGAWDIVCEARNGDSGVIFNPLGGITKLLDSALSDDS